ncbi:MAG: RecX family transcriptional regulator [Candidatus Nomurabacteria bacterium]|jgi:regulatory protein|nr:RecX family transcriptional regulator [Candidatus Nomurabacteria bacterium]
MKIETLSSDLDDEKLVVSKITEAVKDKNRVNVFINDKFYCSLDISQLAELSLKVGQVISVEEWERLKKASDFGKLYVRALEYVMMRQRSVKEMRDYLKRKTFDRRVRVKNPKNGEYQTKLKEGFDEALVELVMERLISRGYVDDRRFTEVWVENRNVGKGISRRKLVVELRQKGIDQKMIEDVLGGTARNDADEMRKIIVKKRGKYDDNKLKQYLMRQGFSYDNIQEVLSSESLEA